MKTKLTKFILVLALCIDLPLFAGSNTGYNPNIYYRIQNKATGGVWTTWAIRPTARMNVNIAAQRVIISSGKLLPMTRGFTGLLPVPAGWRLITIDDVGWSKH